MPTNPVVAGLLAETHGASQEVALAFGHHEDRTPMHSYAATREAAMAAFAKSWRRESGQCPLSGVKRTKSKQGVMSAYDPKRTTSGRFCCDALP